MANTENIHVSGLILPGDEACELLIEAYNKDCWDNEEDYIDAKFLGLYEIKEWLANRYDIYATVIDDDFEGNFYEVNQTEFKDFNDSCSYAIIITTAKAPKLVGIAYNSLEEIANEMEAKMNIFFPDDFDYIGHLGEYEGIVSNY